MEKTDQPFMRQLGGRRGSLTGVDQVNIRIPHRLIGRGNADVVLQADGKSANTVTIAVK
jgi:uncharacterized protein (TIGR03437 family)